MDSHKKQVDDNIEKYSKSIPIIEEQLNISKKVVESGKVHISKSVHHETETINVPVIHEEVDIQRVEVNQFVDSAPSVRYEGETMIIPVLREVVVKKIVLVEELHITKKQVNTNATGEVTLRREEVIVNRANNNETTNHQVR